MITYMTSDNSRQQEKKEVGGRKDKKREEGTVKGKMK